MLEPPNGQAQDIFIAGLKPNQRPSSAPIITEIEKDECWYAQVLIGVVKPYPENLKFLESQGGWYTPFSHAGMIGAYDIRGWHETAGVGNHGKRVSGKTPVRSGRIPVEASGCVIQP